MKLIQSYRPPVLIGVTPDGWLEQETGPTQIDVYEDEQGHLHYEVIHHEAREVS